MKISFQGQYITPMDGRTFTFHLDRADIRIVREWTTEFPACVTVVDGPSINIYDEVEAKRLVALYIGE